MASDPPSDTVSLIARHRAGDPAALGQLMARYRPRIERMVAARLGPVLKRRSTVADVVQDLFVRILEGMDGFEQRSDAHWIDWVARLCEHEIRNQVRAANTKKRGGDLAQEGRALAELGSQELPADSTGVVGRMVRREQEELVDRCAAELSEIHREVILLRDFAGHSWSEITAILGRPSVAASQELHRRARLDLGERLRRAGLTG